MENINEREKASGVISLRKKLSSKSFFYLPFGWNMLLKGQCHEVFDFRYLHGSDSPKPLIIPLGPFRICLKIRGDIRSSWCTTGVVETGGNWKKSSIRKVFHCFFQGGGP
jgi:hypothetical protein